MSRTIAEIRRRLGIFEQTPHRWQKRFGAMGMAGVFRLMQLEDEIANLKQLVADLGLYETIRQAWTGGAAHADPRIHVLRRREGWLVDHKRTERVHQVQGLNCRRNPPRRRTAVVTRGPSVVPIRRDERWSMNLMHDQLHGGRRLRVLTVVDRYTREAMTTEARATFSAHDAIECSAGCGGLAGSRR